jgi:8-oxo-dGTP diphosphatase
VATIKRQRVAAYAVCRRADQILLARYVAEDGGRHWTLPGGGVEHGEDPYDAVQREVEEETGYQARIDRLLGVSSRVVDFPDAEQHVVAIYYRAEITAGELRNETAGSTDLAAWVDLAAVQDLERAPVIDIALELDSSTPLSGHTAQSGS